VIKPVRLAKIVIIQQYHPRLFALLTEGGHYLIDLERRFREAQEVREEEGEVPGRMERAKERETAMEGEGVSAGPLSDFLGRGLLRDLLTCTTPDEPDANFAGPQGLTPTEVQEYVYLTRSTVEEREVEEEAARLPFEPQMVTIPAGPFLMGTPESELDELEKLGVERKYLEREVPQHEVTLEAYAIARYPVTNAEFERFIQDGGYQTRDYWTDAGWKQKESDDWSQPRYWEDKKWNDPSQPVVGVSWYEALAYCRWLSAKSGREYRLPSEAQWEKAARGTDGRRYPWGDDWDPDRCNNKETGPGRTTPVGQYPEGDSPYGVGEMVGQVWEWCSSKYAPYRYKPDDGREDLEGGDTRILRGGSWYDSSPAGVCRCGARDGFYPRYGNYHWGFRCVRTSSS
jgi:formylglycine-generating enzyme required for sulfatase activity